MRMHTAIAANSATPSREIRPVDRIRVKGGDDGYGAEVIDHREAEKKDPQLRREPSPE